MTIDPTSEIPAPKISNVLGTIPANVIEKTNQYVMLYGFCPQTMKPGIAARKLSSWFVLSK
jgi:hypothetical protein